INGQTISVAKTIWTNAGSGTLVSASDSHGAQQYFTLTLQNQQIIGRGDFGQGTIALVSQAGSSIGIYGSGSTLEIQTSHLADGNGLETRGFLNEGTLNVDVGARMNIFGG